MLKTSIPFALLGVAYAQMAKATQATPSPILSFCGQASCTISAYSYGVTVTPTSLFSEDVTTTTLPQSILDNPSLWSSLSSSLFNNSEPSLLVTSVPPPSTTVRIPDRKGGTVESTIPCCGTYTVYEYALYNNQADEKCNPQTLKFLPPFEDAGYWDAFATVVPNSPGGSDKPGAWNPDQLGSAGRCVTKTVSGAPLPPAESGPRTKTMIAVFSTVSGAVPGLFVAPGAGPGNLQGPTGTPVLEAGPGSLVEEPGSVSRDGGGGNSGGESNGGSNAGGSGISGGSSRGENTGEESTGEESTGGGSSGGERSGGANSGDGSSGGVTGNAQGSEGVDASSGSSGSSEGSSSSNGQGGPSNDGGRGSQGHRQSGDSSDGSPEATPLASYQQASENGGGSGGSGGAVGSGESVTLAASAGSPTVKSNRPQLNPNSNSTEAGAGPNHTSPQKGSAERNQAISLGVQWSLVTILVLGAILAP